MQRRRFALLIILFCPAFTAGADSSLAAIEKQLAVGQYYKALSQLDQLLEGDRHNPKYQFTRALALSGSGQHDKAITQYQALIKSYPDLPEPYNNLAVIYFEKGKVDKARAVLEQAMQAHSGYARIYKNLKTLNAAKARDAYSRALQIPAKQNAVTLASSDRLALQTAAIASVRPAPAVRAARQQPTKAVLRYQAKNPGADTKAVRQTKPAGTGQDFEKASAVLHKWAQAWANKDVSQYLQFYSEGYSPAGMSRRYWEKQRHRRINKPEWIKVKLRNIQLHKSRGQQMVLRLEQEYSADSYSDVTRKEFVMQQFSGKWRIIKERGLGYIRQ